MVGAFRRRGARRLGPPVAEVARQRGDDDLRAVSLCEGDQAVQALVIVGDYPLLLRHGIGPGLIPANGHAEARTAGVRSAVPLTPKVPQGGEEPRVGQEVHEPCSNGTPLLQGLVEIPFDELVVTAVDDEEVGIVGDHLVGHDVEAVHRIGDPGDVDDLDRSLGIGGVQHVREHPTEGCPSVPGKAERAGTAETEDTQAVRRLVREEGLVVEGARSQRRTSSVSLAVALEYGHQAREPLRGILTPDQGLDPGEPQRRFGDEKDREDRCNGQEERTARRGTRSRGVYPVIFA